MTGLDDTFHALAHPTRRRMLDLLAERERNVTDLAAEFDSSLNVVSKHIMVMEQAKLVRRQQQGRVHQIRLNAAPLREAADFVEKYRLRWEGKLDRLGDYLNAMAEAETSEKPAKSKTSSRRS